MLTGGGRKARTDVNPTSGGEGGRCLGSVDMAEPGQSEPFLTAQLGKHLGGKREVTV